MLCLPLIGVHVRECVSDLGQDQQLVSERVGDGSSLPRTVVVEHITAITGEVPKPMKTNYHQWALKMQVHLESMEI